MDAVPCAFSRTQYDGGYEQQWDDLGPHFAPHVPLYSDDDPDVQAFGKTIDLDPGLNKPIDPIYENLQPSGTDPFLEPWDEMYDPDPFDETVNPTIVTIPASNTVTTATTVASSPSCTVKMRVAAMRSSKRTRQALEDEVQDIDDISSDRRRRKKRKTVKSAKPPHPPSSASPPPPPRRSRISEEEATRIRWGPRSRMECGVPGCSEMLYINDMQSARVHFYSHFHDLTPAQASRLVKRREKREAEGRDEEDEEDEEGVGEGSDGVDDGNEGDRGAQTSKKPQVQCPWIGCSKNFTDGAMQIHRHLELDHMKARYRCPKGCGKKNFTRAYTAHVHGDKCT